MSQEAYDALQEVYREAHEKMVAALPPEDRPAGPKEPMCLAEHDGFKCSKPPHSVGRHVAHGMFNVEATWGGETE